MIGYGLTDTIIFDLLLSCFVGCPSLSPVGSLATRSKMVYLFPQLFVLLFFFQNDIYKLRRML